MGRRRRGYSLAKASWSVIRDDPTLLWLPLLAALALLVSAAAIFVPVAAIGAGHRSHGAYYAGLALAAFVLTFVSVFFRVAFAVVVDGRLDGRATTLDEGVAAAAARAGAIAGWALISTTVGLILQAVRQLPLLGSVADAIVSSLLGLAWSAVTYFVVPALALESRGAKASLERSALVVRARWGEGLAGFVSIGGAFVVVLVPIAALTLAGAAMLRTSIAAGAILLGVAVAALLAAVLVSTALQQVFQVVLFRFATNREVPAAFSRSELESAARPRRRWGLLGR